MLFSKHFSLMLFIILLTFIVWTKTKSTIHLRHIGLGGHESKWWQFFIRAHWAARWCG